MQDCAGFGQSGGSVGERAMLSKKVRDWTKLESYVGLSFEKAKETIKSCGHMLAFGEDEWAIPVVKTFEGESGDEAGMAALTAALFMQKYGPGSTAMQGVQIYKDIARRQNRQDLICRVQNLEFIVYFAEHSNVKDLKWPMKWPYEDDQRRAGLANVMLGLAMQKLMEDGTTTCQCAAFGIQRFIEEHYEKRGAA